MRSRRILTSESVTEGHPDKIADQVSDAILDAALADDIEARVACEVLVTTGLILIAGEMSTDAAVDLHGIARATLREIGYTDASYGIDSESCGVLVAIDRQSPDIARGVAAGGAGDQGMMFGYATNELHRISSQPAADAPAAGQGATIADSFMPAPLVLANTLVERLSTLRRGDPDLAWLRPDGKAQVTIEYEDGLPRRVLTVVLSTQHSPEIELESLRAAIVDRVISPALPKELFDPETTEILINPTGRFVIGGPHGDTGLTGRKLVVDTYGGAARHGGGAFSGKDPTKVDRSGAYGARWAAKHVVAAGLADRCEVALAYAIGIPEPVAVEVDTFGTGIIPDERIADAVSRVFDFRPQALIEALGLASPIYRPTATFGHFGRPVYTARVKGEEHTFFPWERLDRLDDLLAATGH